MIEKVIVLNNARHMTTNINHVFSSEVNQIMGILDQDPSIESVIVLDHDDSIKSMVWRLRIISAIFKNVYMYNLPLPFNNYELVFLPAPNYFTLPFREFKFIPPNYQLINFVKRIKHGLGLPLERVGSDVIFVNRKPPFRCLYDVHTKRPLHEVLSELMPKSISFKVCFFEEMTVDEQAEAVSKAKYFICPHGAGLTNMIFLPEDSTVVEFNFRKYWTCDPICEKHWSGELTYKQPCQEHPPVFHKADYYSLAMMLKKKYVEFEIDEMDELQDGNPISWKKLFVNPDPLIELVTQ